MGDLKYAVSSASLGVDDTFPADVKVSGSSGDPRFRRTAGGPSSPPDLRNALAVKVREQVDQVEVLEEERSVRAGTLSSVGLLNGRTLRRGVDGAVALIEGKYPSTRFVFVSVCKDYSPSGRLLAMAFLAAGMTAMRRSAGNPETDACAQRHAAAGDMSVHSLRRALLRRHRFRH